MRLRIKEPLQATIALRPRGSDFATFREVVDSEIYQIVVKHLPNVRTVIDLGANIGLASLYFATKYPVCRIFAVEPHPQTFALLRENLRPLIESRRAIVMQAAVWSHNTTVEPTTMTDRYSCFQVQEGDDGCIPGMTIGELIARWDLPIVDLLKVDIEGAEIELFKDVSWLRMVRAVAIEFHQDSRRACNFDALMTDNGFRVIESPHTTLALR